MLPDRVSNPGPLTYESGALPIALRGPALSILIKNLSGRFFPFQAMDQLKRLTGGEYLAFSNSVYVQTILHVHILLHLQTNATSDWITSNICGSTRRLYERVISLWLTSGVTFFESALKNVTPDVSFGAV